VKLHIERQWVAATRRQVDLEAPDVPRLDEAEGGCEEHRVAAANERVGERRTRAAAGAMTNSSTTVASRPRRDLACGGSIAAVDTAAFLAPASGLLGTILGAMLTYRLALSIADKNSGAAMRLAEKNAELAAGLAEKSATLAAETGREVEERQAARELVIRQYDARAKVQRFVWKHIEEGKSWANPIKVEAVEIAAEVAAAFRDVQFAEAIFNRPFVFSATWGLGPRNAQPYSQRDVYRMLEVFDAEMMRVIAETEKLTGSGGVARPIVPEEFALTPRTRET